MSKNAEKKEREDRASRLQSARRKANLGGAKALSDKFGWSENNYKAHESGRNGFGLADARKYAKAFNVSVTWLYLGEGSETDEYAEADDVRSEVIDLFDKLPTKVQEVVLDHIRALAAIDKNDSPSSD
ncbi:helix-turn-helix transcriptional regulator [Ochrobactrum sp. S46]|nr:helix-turn-helix transcriptional regulator [Ochrobactrum sp. S45]MBK0042329.1 helix-turn-helix transcriptional regulator [Ochrobactrum sp. S46]